MLAVSLISYIDRNTLALLAPTILRETGLSGEQYGFIISAFSIAYMLANPIWGKILDRAGLRLGMTVAVSCWTVASVAHAFAGRPVELRAQRVPLSASAKAPPSPEASALWCRPCPNISGGGVLR